MIDYSKRDKYTISEAVEIFINEVSGFCINDESVSYTEDEVIKLFDEAGYGDYITGIDLQENLKRMHAVIKKERERAKKIEVTFRLCSEYFYEKDKDRHLKETIEMRSEYRLLYSPNWGIVKNHSTFSKEDTVWLSMGIDRHNAEYLLRKIANNDTDDIKRELEHAGSFIGVIGRNYRIRMYELESNLHLFDVGNGRIDRQKYYEWAIKNNKQIVSEFSLFDSEEPFPTKGDSSSLDRWVKWRKNVKGDILSRVIDASVEHGYRDDSAIKRSWKRCGFSKNK